MGDNVAPRVGAWIETAPAYADAYSNPVAPRVGAWIETNPVGDFITGLSSHPVWVRGLKQYYKLPPLSPDEVAPRVGAWIETHHATGNNTPTTVAPRVGAWIETKVQSAFG